MKFVNWLTALVTFKKWRAQRRRKRYDELKALIVKNHLAGKGGLFVPKKYDFKDLQSFRPPMYALARTEKNQPIIYWRQGLMTEEVGPPRPIDPVIAKAKSNLELASQRTRVEYPPCIFHGDTPTAQNNDTSETIAALSVIEAMAGISDSGEWSGGGGDFNGGGATGDF